MRFANILKSILSALSEYLTRKPDSLKSAENKITERRGSTMEITVNRIKSNKQATLSTVSIDGLFECFGLEDEYRYEKIASETRIPSGRYQVKLRTVGGFHTRYSIKFPDFHKGMLHVQDVPGFEYILIHIGNTEKDTAGCLLVGKNATSSAALTVPASTPAYVDLYKKVVEAAEKEELFINYIDNDGVSHARAK